MTSQRWQNKNKKTLAKKFSAIFYFDEIFKSATLIISGIKNSWKITSIP